MRAPALKQQITRFVTYQRAHPPRERHEATLAELIEASPRLDRDGLDRTFAELAPRLRGHVVSQRTMTHVRRFCYDTLAAVNQLPVEQRFLVLETIDFFSSASGIHRLIQLLLLGDATVRSAMAQLFLDTFRSTTAVVRTLTRDEALFAGPRGASQKGELYVFRSDLARRLLRLFPRDFVAEEGRRLGVDQSLPVDLLGGILEGRSPEAVRGALIQDPTALITAQVDYMTLLQTHHALVIYARVRHEYLKRFLLEDLLRREALAGLDAADLSALVAGFLLTNRQLRPEEGLIHDLTRPERHALPGTRQALRRFLDQLAPSTLDTLVQQVHAALKRLGRPDADLEAVFGPAHGLSADQGILARLETGLLDMADRGVIAMSDLVQRVLEPIRDLQRRRRAEREALAAPMMESLAEDEEASGAAPGPRSKDPTAIAELGRYGPVRTDRQGYRGGTGKTIFKDYVDSGKVFANDERTIYHFKRAFFRLFAHFRARPDSPVQQIRHPRATPSGDTVQETYLAFRLPPVQAGDIKDEALLLALGTTHFPRNKPDLRTVLPESPLDRLLDPYVVLFVGAPTPQGAGRAVSRKVQGRGTTFNEVRLLDAHLPLVYRALYILLHHLPDRTEGWQDPDVQWCVEYLADVLERLER